jgi:hypothetical protein
MRFSGSLHQQQQKLSSSSELGYPKFQTAYVDIEDRIKRRILTFDIEKIDSCCISLTTEDCVCIVGDEREYANAILMRLCVRALMSKRQGGFESTNVIFIDAGNNSDVFYQCVNFARQYGLDIKKVLQGIMITRAFTIYQLADLIIYQLPIMIQQFNTKVIVISDLLNMFTQEHDPNIDYNEAIFLIKEIMNSIKNTLDKTLVVVSFQQQHNNKSYAYDKILLPRFDKHIEITNRNNNSKINLLLDVKIYDYNYSKKNYKNYNRSLLLEERDLQIVYAST